MKLQGTAKPEPVPDSGNRPGVNNNANNKRREKVTRKKNRIKRNWIKVKSRAKRRLRRELRAPLTDPSSLFHSFLLSLLFMPDISRIFPSSINHRLFFSSHFFLFPLLPSLPPPPSPPPLPLPVCSAGFSRDCQLFIVIKLVVTTTIRPGTAEC